MSTADQNPNAPEVHCGFPTIEVSLLVFPSGPALQPSDVFEQPVPAGQRKIEFHITVPDPAAGEEDSGRGLKDDEHTGTFIVLYTPATVRKKKI